MRLVLAFGLAALTGLVLAAIQPGVVTPSERAAGRRIRPETLRADVRFLASDLLEGRGPASRGDQLAQAYIAARLEAMGLEPGAPDGSWLQAFELVGTLSRAPDTLRVQRGTESVELRFFEEYIASSGVETPEARLDDAEIVFVGYGIVAPEFDWDDYKGADVRGKLLLVMNNDPEEDPSLFAGRTRLYYGRWSYKYEEAARKGAAGAMIIHTNPSAGYPWKVVQTSWSREQFSLPEEEGPRLQIESWVSEEGARRIAALAGRDLDTLRASAQTRDFRPVPLGVSVSVALRNEISRRRTANVIGRVTGSDPELRDQAVLYTAHHDHLGRKDEARPGEDGIYNGAHDNATGVAALLAIAEAVTALPRPPRRTILFAAVAAEEAGLAGSRYLAANPPVPPGRLAANINMDGMNIWGRSRDVTQIGLGKSNLDGWVEALAATQGRRVVPDQFPDLGYFYRSDQFSLARIGVPAVYLKPGTETVGRPPGWGRQQQEAYTATDYHQPSDELQPTWDFSGMVEDTRLLFHLGLKVADTSPLPAWNPGDEFEAARKRALAAAP